MDHEFALQSESLLLPLAGSQRADGSFILGRSSKCELVVKDVSVSRRHAVITIDEKDFVVCDLNSRNGTYVDGEKVRSSRVQCGQRLRFGQVSFVLINSRQVDSNLETDSCGSSPSAVELNKFNFTPAQRRVLRLVLEGHAEKEIARRLHLSPHTVHNHLQAVYGNLGVHSRSELLARLLRSTGQTTSK